MISLYGSWWSKWILQRNGIALTDFAPKLNLSVDSFLFAPSGVAGGRGAQRREDTAAGRPADVGGGGGGVGQRAEPGRTQRH